MNDDQPAHDQRHAGEIAQCQLLTEDHRRQQRHEQETQCIERVGSTQRHRPQHQDPRHRCSGINASNDAGGWTLIQREIMARTGLAIAGGSERLFCSSRQFILHVFQGDAFGFGHHHPHPDQLQYHHEAEESEDHSRVECFDHLWEERGQ